MIEIQRIGLISAGKHSAVIIAIYSAIVSIPLYLLVGHFDPLVGVITYVLIQIGMIAVGFVLGALPALIYNILSKFVGGVKVETDLDQQPSRTRSEVQAGRTPATQHD